VKARLIGIIAALAGVVQSIALTARAVRDRVVVEILYNLNDVLVRHDLPCVANGLVDGNGAQTAPSTPRPWPTNFPAPATVQDTRFFLPWPEEAGDDMKIRREEFAALARASYSSAKAPRREST